MKLVKDTDNKLNENKQVSDKDAEEAFKTILTWMGEDPNREGLLETPKRVVKAFKEYFKGYKEDPDKICLLYTSPSPRDATLSRMPSSA